MKDQKLNKSLRLSQFDEKKFCFFSFKILK